MTADRWYAAYLAGAQSNGCFPPQSTWPQIQIAGQRAAVHGGFGECGFTEAVAIVGGRAYVFTGYADLRSFSGGIFDRALFDAFLSTVQFAPASANDRPVPSPSPG